ncbi:MAG TPA: hypothetical protein PK089_05035 [Methanoregulaceae archaeon]|nr:hypothetical protein [Methanoregulaceae archaeon]HQJ87019.1 hypothetical protein [Methanoregulaceae archaeon]
MNQEADRLTDIEPKGQHIRALLERYGSRTSNGDPVNPGVLPYARALKGGGDPGERLGMCLLDGSTYFALIGPRPVIVDGKVVAALSIGHDFAAYARQLARLTGGGER